MSFYGALERRHRQWELPESLLAQAVAQNEPLWSYYMHEGDR